MRRLSVLWGILLAAGFLFVPAGADAMQGFGISPTSQEVPLDPGAKATGKLTILNDGDTDVTYKMYATDYRVTGENYKGDFSSQAAAANVSAVSWFTLPAGSAVIKARQQVDIPYTVTVPSGASVGGHYAAVFAETIPPTPKTGSQVARIDRVGSIFYLAIGGNLKPAGHIASVDVPWVQALTPLSAALRIQNDGNVHFAADVSAQLETPFGKVGRPVQMRGEILPGTTRRYALELPAGAPIGIYNVKLSVNYLGNIQRVNHWTILMPRLTFMIVAGTLFLLMIMAVWGLVRRLRRRLAAKQQL